MHLYPQDEAVQQVGKDETVYSYRDARFVHIIAGVDPDPAAMPADTTWVRDYWSALHPVPAGGGYVNFLMDEGEDRVKATYRENYELMAALKDKYDPTNLFHMNQNLKPASGLAARAAPYTSTLSTYWRKL